MIPPTKRHIHNNERETARIEAFSDGVFAIAITLLVLDIKVPPLSVSDQSSLLVELVRQWPTYLAFTLSFLLILIMWINHHRLFIVIRRADDNLLLLNGLLLFGITAVPFPTKLVAEYLNHRDQSIAVMVYSAWGMLLAILFNLLWRYAAHKNRLFDHHTDLALVAFISRQYAFGPLLYLMTIVVAFFNPLLSLLLSLIIALFFAMPNKKFNQLLEDRMEDPKD